MCIQDSVSKCSRYYTLAPVKKVSLQNNSEPWFDGYLLSLISNRDKMFVRFRKYRTSELYKDYKVLRNQAQRAIKKAKKDYIRNQIEKKDIPQRNCGNISRSWECLQEKGLKM